MGYNTLISKSLKKAFIAVQDLAQDVTFQKRTVSDFSFGTKQVVDGGTVGTVVKAIPVATKKKSSKRNIKRQELMFKHADVPDVTLYDSVVISGVAWKLGAPIVSDGFIVLLEVYTEI